MRLVTVAPTDDPSIGVINRTGEVFFKPVPNDGTLDNSGNGLGASAFPVEITAPASGPYEIRLEDRRGIEPSSHVEQGGVPGGEKGGRGGLFGVGGDLASLVRLDGSLGTVLTRRRIVHACTARRSLGVGTHHLWSCPLRRHVNSHGRTRTRRPVRCCLSRTYPGGLRCLSCGCPDGARSRARLDHMQRHMLGRNLGRKVSGDAHVHAGTRRCLHSLPPGHGGHHP